MAHARITIGPVPPCEPPYTHEECCAGSCCGGRCLKNHHPIGYPRGGNAGRAPAGPAGTRPSSRPEHATIRHRELDPTTNRATRDFLGLYLEVLTGHRTPAQLRARCAPSAYQQLVSDLPPGRPPRGLVRIRALRITSPAPAVIEATAVLSREGRVWAVALRLERPTETWLCTHLQTVQQQHSSPPDGQQSPQRS